MEWINRYAPFFRRKWFRTILSGHVERLLGVAPSIARFTVFGDVGCPDLKTDLFRAGIVMA